LKNQNEFETCSELEYFASPPDSEDFDISDSSAPGELFEDAGALVAGAKSVILSNEYLTVEGTLARSLPYSDATHYKEVNS